MKLKFTPVFLSLSVGLALAPVIHLARAEEIKYSDLEKKIVIDNTPVAAPNGAVSSYASALEKVMPSVVTVFSSRAVERSRNPQQEELFRRMFPDIPEDFFDREQQEGGREEGLGSGVIIFEDGYILTNNHVVGDADEIKVTLPNDKHKEHKATVVGADPATDVALIKIDAKDLPHVTIGDSSGLKIGDVALAVGNPLGLEQTATIGIISAVGRSDLRIVENGYESFIQTDAAINRGNSGGALVDAQGRLIGIPTAIQSGMSGGNIGIGFAIPSNMALNIVQRLLEGGGVVKRGALGVGLRDIDPNMAKALGRDDREGVVVGEVFEGTPAEKAGIKPGDLIIGFNGKPVTNVTKLRLDISNTAPGVDTNFDIIRKGKKIEVKVKLGELEKVLAGATGPVKGKGSSSDELIAGVTVDDLDDDTRSSLNLAEGIEGVLVKSVEDDSEAAKAGLAPGMVITQIDQVEIADAEAARKLVEEFKGEVLLVQVYANGRRDILAVPVKE